MSPCQGEGRRFESGLPLESYRGIEQLAARQAHNLEVLGSSPSPATKKRPNSLGLFSDLNAGPILRDAGERAQSGGGGQTEEPEGDESRDQVRVPQLKRDPIVWVSFNLFFYCLPAYKLTCLPAQLWSSCSL